MRWLVVGEGAAPSRLANLAISGVYKAPLHGGVLPTMSRSRIIGSKVTTKLYQAWQALPCPRFLLRGNIVGDATSLPRNNFEGPVARTLT
jgi:hypothetical protein